ncbi:hypothetical protein [Amphritea japonica]|uniref:hypothetical protein n=1 Tax=Amphritea japonica TaxID=452627 RepID=UPI00035E73F7|nr:hypothetical protein [Amphritea japonica]
MINQDKLINRSNNASKYSAIEHQAFGLHATTTMQKVARVMVIEEKLSVIDLFCVNTVTKAGIATEATVIRSDIIVSPDGDFISSIRALKNFPFLTTAIFL